VHTPNLISARRLSNLQKGAVSLQKFLIDMEKSFSKVTLALLFLSLFTSVAAVAPTARAQSIWVTLTPSEGPVGTQVIVQITNYHYGDTQFSVAFGTAIVGTIMTGPSYAYASTLFNVPTVSLGEYTVTVSTSSGEFGTAKFTVTQEGSVAPTETPAATPVETPTEPSTGIPSGGAPTYKPVKPKAGFWSPLNVGIVAIAVAAVCFVMVVFVRRGRQERPSLEDSSSYKPASTTENVPPYGYRSSVEDTSRYRYRPPVQETSPYRYRSPLEDTSPYKFRSSVPDTSPYYPRASVPSTRSTVPPTVSQTVTRSQAPPYTKVCKHCKRVVRDDLNVCPYCFKRLR
jgi:hypothetical protein